MKNRFITLVALCCLLAACSPMSKESYLEKYAAFMSEVSENYKSYVDKDWEKKTEKFKQFSDEWYTKFKDDLTWQEKLKVTGFQAKFYYYRTLQQSSSTIKELLVGLNVDKIKEQVQYYINNDMKEALTQLYEEACMAGDAATEAVTEILNELQVNIEKLQ
jgi:hypothetical protein